MPLPETTDLPPSPWFERFLDGSAPWLKIATLPERPSHTPYGFRAERQEVHDGQTYNKGDIVPSASREELKAALQKRPQTRWIALPQFPHLTHIELLEEATEQVDLKAYRGRVLASMRRPFSTLMIFAALGFYTKNFLFYIFALLLGGFPLLDSGLDLLRRPDRWPPEKLNRKRVNEIFFSLWVKDSRKKVAGLGIGVAALVAVFILQSVIGLMPSIELAALVKPAVRDGEWWRLMTAGLLHGHPIHILFNGMALYSLGSVLSVLASTRLLTIVFCLSILGGSLFSVWLMPDSMPSVGASGGILGLLGFLCVYAQRFRDQLPDFLRSGIYRSVVMVALLGVIGMNFIDNACHLGGFLTGAAIGIVKHRSLVLGERNPSRLTVVGSWVCGGVLFATLLKILILYLPLLKN